MNPYDRARNFPAIRESAPARQSEIEIQARLFAGEYGTRWTTTDGRVAEVVHFGEWNREAGPDFKGAQIRLDGGAAQIGDLEVDMDARDWERHGHATNPGYCGVLLQLFVHPCGPAAFARTSDQRAVCQAMLAVGSSAPCSLRHSPGAVGPASALSMIEEAADFRLRAKQSAYARSVSLHGADAALFHAIASGLGYKNNAIPFLLVAQRTGLRHASLPEGEARLFGLAGFLESRTFDSVELGTRQYLKPLWNNWWAERASMERLVLPAAAWKMSGLRPSNHPHRRMGALAAIGSHFPRLRKQIREGGRKGFEDFFGTLKHPYWSRHWNLSAGRLDRDLALVGCDRVADLLVNAFLPSLPAERAHAEMANLQGPAPGGRVRRACEWLTGSSDPRLMRSARHQQGLLQLFADFGSLTALEAWGKIQAA